MKLDEAIKRSLLAWVREKHDPTAVRVVDYQRQIHTGGEYPTRIWYTHSGPTREQRSVLYHYTVREMFEQLDLDLTGES